MLTRLEQFLLERRDRRGVFASAYLAITIEIQITAIFGQVIGVGPGRGIGLLYMVLGFLSLLAVMVGLLYPRLRRVDSELPDAVGEER